MGKAPIPLNRRRSDRSGPDYFPTPPWGTRALCEFLKNFAPIINQTVWEPACGEGFMVRPLQEYFKKVTATDLHDRSATYPQQDDVVDFLLDWSGDPAVSADWIITNPPFVNGAAFVELALRRARYGVAMLVKQQFLEGITRHRELYNTRPPQWILQFVERLPMVSGRVDPDVATNQAYIWIIWIKDPDLRAVVQRGDPNPRFHWIAPCRRALEVPADYTFIKLETKLAAAPLFDPDSGEWAAHFDDA